MNEGAEVSILEENFRKIGTKISRKLLEQGTCRSMFPT
jgi:hypothetical protein